MTTQQPTKTPAEIRFEAACRAVHAEADRIAALIRRAQAEAAVNVTERETSSPEHVAIQDERKAALAEWEAELLRQIEAAPVAPAET